MSKKRPEEFRSKEERIPRFDRKSQLNAFTLVCLALVTSWMIALWNKLIEKIGIDLTSLQIQLFFASVFFFCLLFTYNRF